MPGGDLDKSGEKFHLNLEKQLNGFRLKMQKIPSRLLILTFSSSSRRFSSDGFLHRTISGLVAGKFNRKLNREVSREVYQEI